MLIILALMYYNISHCEKRVTPGPDNKNNFNENTKATEKHSTLYVVPSTDILTELKLKT